MSNSLRSSLVLLAFLSLLFSEIWGAFAATPETMAKLNAAIGNWKSITPEILLKPDNADLLAELRLLAKDTRYTSARVPLIKLGDEEVIASCLEQLRAQQTNGRSSAVNQLSFSGNPKIIPMLAGDLNKEESPEIVFLGDRGTTPVSMAAASVIKSIILTSPVFSVEVKEWAKSLPKVSVNLRSGLRNWWEVNKEAIERGDYQWVVPVVGEIGKPTILPAAPPIPTPSPSAATVPPSTSPTPPTDPVSQPPTGFPPPAIQVAQAPVSSPPPTALVTQAPIAHKPLVWPWVVGMGALIAIAFLVLKSRG